jgi:hypothetical protein
MRVREQRRAGYAWPELLLALAIVALVLQLYPSLWFRALWALDVRNWSQAAWLYFNIAIIFVLVGMRFGPELMADLRRQKWAALKRLGARRARTGGNSSTSDDDAGYSARVRRDAEWCERAKRRLPWH